MKNLPAAVRPREKLLAHGANALADAELIALLLRTGARGVPVLQLAQQLLDGSGGLGGLLAGLPGDMPRLKGLGPAKRAEVAAVMELARRSLVCELRQRTAWSSIGQVKAYVRLQLGALPHEVFGVLFLDAQHRLLQWEEMFRGSITQLSVTLLRKYFGWFRLFTATQSESQFWSRTPSCPKRLVARAGS